MLNLLLENGMKAFSNGDKTKACQLLSTATEQEPENIYAWFKFRDWLPPIYVQPKVLQIGFRCY